MDNGDCVTQQSDPIVMEPGAQSFWNDQFFQTFRQIAYRYGTEPKSPYPFYEIRRDHVCDWLSSRKPGHAIDIGCGGGHVLEALLAAGWTGAGCDFSPNMVRFAKERLAAIGYGAVDVDLRNATDLRAYGAETANAALCLGPIEYLDADEVVSAYAGMHRLLAPSGVLVCAHVNALFDLFTSDGFTAPALSALSRETYGLDDASHNALRRVLEDRLGSQPDASIRNAVATRPDNPLTIGDTLAHHGFILKDIRFYRFYVAPPFAGRALGWPETDAIDHEKRLATGWPGHVLASSFLTFSEKQ